MPSIHRLINITSFGRDVLNLVIRGIPSIPRHKKNRGFDNPYVLNLVISGIPSILPKKYKNVILISF